MPVWAGPGLLAGRGTRAGHLLTTKTRETVVQEVPMRDRDRGGHHALQLRLRGRSPWERRLHTCGLHASVGSLPDAGAHFLLAAAPERKRGHSHGKVPGGLRTRAGIKSVSSQKLGF